MTPRNDYADPLIDEVRERRRDLYKACGENLEHLFEAIQQLQAEHPEKLTDHRRGTPSPVEPQ